MQEDGTPVAATVTETAPTVEPLKALPGRRSLAPVAAEQTASNGADRPGEGKFKPTLAKSRGKDEARSEPEPAKSEAKVKKVAETPDPTKVVSIDSFRKKP